MKIYNKILTKFLLPLSELVFGEKMFSEYKNLNKLLKLDGNKLQEIQHKKRLEEKDADFAAVVAPRLQKLQEELDYYYLLSRKQLELIQASEDLQARTARLLLGSDH